jgi:hypothetical protein
MGFNFPQGGRLLCENPICEASATTIAQLPVPAGVDPTGTPPEICGCAEHINQLIIGKRVVRLIQLKVAGRRNEVVL